MDEKYPDRRTGDENQTIYTERAVADAPLTGDARVDAAIEGLSRLAGTPPAEHVAVLEEAHGRLRDILGELAEDRP
jgi:hypothetical protein